MERNYEDKLMELAFGELNPEEATRLEARIEADPLASQELTFTRQLREDLLSLADTVPPDQLSKERLRQAILGNGLHPVPMRRSLGLGWLWAPAAAFAAAFVFVFLRNQPAEATFVQEKGKERSNVTEPLIPRRSQGNRVAVNNNSQRNDLPTLGLSEFSSGSAALSGMNLGAERPIGRSEEATVTESVQTAEAAQPILEEPAPNRLADEPRALVRGQGATPIAGTPRGKRPYDAADEEGTMVDMAPRGGSSADSTIVLIRPDQNSATGAQTAKELEKENVLVGG